MTWNPMPSKRATPCGVALGRGRRSLFLGFVRTGGIDAFGVDVIHEARGLSAALVERDELIVRAVCGKFHETTQLAIGELFEIDGDAHAVPGFSLVAHASIIARLGGVSCR
nr:MAG TPA: hypothetical protein [Caudoviricetes sp.]